MSLDLQPGLLAQENILIENGLRVEFVDRCENEEAADSGR
jgi:hypothetical protein